MARHHRLSVAFVLAVLIAAAFGLASCGRNGPPLLPPGPAAAQPPATPTAAVPSLVPVPGIAADTATAQANAQKNGFDAFGNPVAPAGQKKSFLLDPILQ